MRQDIERDAASDSETAQRTGDAALLGLCAGRGGHRLRRPRRGRSGVPGRAGRACSRGPRGLAALRRRAVLLLDDGRRPARHDGRSGVGDRGRPAPPWSSCRRSPAADPDASRKCLGAPALLAPHVSTGAWVLLVAVVAALAFGLFRALTDGRFRGTHRVHGCRATSRRSDRRRARGARARVGARRHALGGRARRAGDAAAVLLGVLRAVPGDPPGPRRGRRRACRASRTSRSTRSTTSTSYAASGSCARRRRSSSTSTAAR